MVRQTVINNGRTPPESSSPNAKAVYDAARAFLNDGSALSELILCFLFLSITRCSVDGDVLGQKEQSRTSHLDASDPHDVDLPQKEAWNDEAVRQRTVSLICSRARSSALDSRTLAKLPTVEEAVQMEIRPLLNLIIQVVGEYLFHVLHERGLMSYFLMIAEDWHPYVAISDLEIPTDSAMSA